MGGGTSGIAKQQLATTNTLGSNAQNTANSLYGTLQPFYQQEMTNPTAAAATAIQASNQALGGGQAAATGAAGLNAARTRNTAGESAVIDEAARQAGQQQSTNAANITAGTQQAGAAGLGGLYGQNIGEAESMYGLGPATIKAGQQPGFWQSLMGGLGSLSKTAGSAVGMP